MADETVPAAEYRKRMGLPPAGWDRVKPSEVSVVRLPKPRMNKTEVAYSALLETRKRLGEITDYRFEEIKLRLADRTWYTPDFFVIVGTQPRGFIGPPTDDAYDPPSLEVHEVKGFWRDDARIKFKVAAELYPCFKFTAVQRVKGEWRYERIGPGWREQ